MKVQKLGLVLSVNMAAACLMMQGCKKDGVVPLDPHTTTVVAPAPATSSTPTAATPTAVAPVSQEVVQPATGTAPSGVMVEPGPVVQPAPVAQPAPQPVVAVVPPPPQPSKVPTVRPLPPVPPKKVHTAPAGTKPVAPVADAKPAATAADGFVYTVKPGDQLFAVSRRYNVRLAAIAKANPGLNVDRIRIGQKIVIPGVAAEQAPTAVATTKPEQAKPEQPVEMNAAATPTAANITPPAKSSQTAPVAVKTTPAPGVKTVSSSKPYTGPTKEYKVRSGDFIGKIAYENGITIRQLKEMNKLTKDNLRVGQVLLIPAEKVTKPADGKKPVEAKPAPKTTEPTVDVKPAEQPKEEPKVEEEKKEVEPQPVVEAKKDDAAPATPEQPVVEEKIEKPAEPAEAGNFYIVKDGDDLVSVSIACGISPSQLMDLNGLKAGDAIKPGDKLKLPAHATKPQND